MSLAAVALSQVTGALKRYGCPVVVTHVSHGSGPDSGTDVTSAVSTHGVMDASSASSLGYRFGADLVKAGDHKLTLPGSVALEAGDHLTALGFSWRVVTVQPVYVQATKVSQEALVRR